MRKIDSDWYAVIETHAILKGAWVILLERYGKLYPDERVSFYEYKDYLFCIIDRMGIQTKGKTIIYQYANKEEGNKHFLQIKSKVESVGALIRKDKDSFLR